VRDVDVNLYDNGRLREQFGPFTEGGVSALPAHTERDLVGDRYRRILAETTRLVAHQWREHIERSAVKGFLFHGGVGVGKTTMGKRLAYELCRIFGSDGSVENPANEVVLVMVDGSDIARGRYGDSEERLAELFEYARDGESHGHGHRHADDPARRTVLLFDDVESLFMARSAGTAREWHFSQNSVFFHSIDELDTAHTIVVLTTNRLDLLDEALIDRFLPYEFETPSAEVLIRVARERCRLQHLTGHDLAQVLARIRGGPPVRSIREVERLVTKAYVDKVLGD
jgi:SpoVK/Ycf46/Vps4 family AAA+-type ATPase